MTGILSQLKSPLQLHSMNLAELDQTANEIRETLCSLLSRRSAHFASNLGVVELCLALHSTYDFSYDRLIWDTGHQIYPQKLITGRYDDFHTIRTRGGLMGYPNPAESEYDLFMTGHAGCSVSTMVGIRSGDDLHDENDRYAVAVIGDGALPSGIVFEAFNNVAGMKSNLLVILNDNEMSICPRVGGLAKYLDRLRGNPAYTGFKSEVVNILNKVPLFGDPAERLLAQIKEGVKAGLHGGMMFEEFGFRYFGPVDGHNIGLLKKYLKMVRKISGPVLLHVITRKGHGYKPAAEDPVFFHTPPAFDPEDNTSIKPVKSSTRAYTDHAADAIAAQLEKNPLATVITAAMCQGNKLEAVRERFPKQFFDVGICESHAVAFAAGQAKTGCRPIVDIYSTFLQRSFDQIFQEVCLQNLPVTFMMDRAGLTATDGPTHHGTFDICYMRMFPNMVVMTPGDANDIAAMLDFSMSHNAPCAIRYPKDVAVALPRPLKPVELGRAEIIAWGRDGMILCAGTPLMNCIRAAEALRKEGLEVGVVSARFVKPLDSETIAKLLREMPFVVTVEEGMLMGGFGSAVLELGNTMNIDCAHVHRLGVPDRFVEHAERHEVMADIGIDAAGIAGVCRQLAKKAVPDSGTVASSPAG
jgi:1-deoxy-D-xylulose-5-phosphate synthase